jgi:hypothetical protein
MIGVSFAIVGLVAVLLWSAEPLRRRVVHAFGVVAGVVGPLVLFVVYENHLAGSGNRRPLSFHPPGKYDLRPALDSVSRWLLPTDPHGALTPTHRWLAGLLLVVAVLVLAWMAWATGPVRLEDPVADDEEKEEDDGDEAHRERLGDLEARRLVGILALALGSYLLVLVASRTVTDASAAFQFGGRLLVPSLPLVWLLVAGIVAQWAARRTDRGNEGRRVVAIVGALGLVLGLAQLSRTSDVFGWPSGPGVNHQAAPSPTPPVVERLVHGGVVVTNAPNRIWHDTGLDAITIPARKFALSGERNPHLARDIAQVRSLLQRRGGVVVYLDGNVLTTFHLVLESQLVRGAGLREVARTRDGRIYALAQ